MREGQGLGREGQHVVVGAGGTPPGGPRAQPRVLATLEAAWSPPPSAVRPPEVAGDAYAAPQAPSHRLDSAAGSGLCSHLRHNLK